MRLLPRLAQIALHIWPWRGPRPSWQGDHALPELAAGEVHVLNIPTDEELMQVAYIRRLARDISKKIEENLQYPGQIRVTVLRETRAAEYAR